VQGWFLRVEAADMRRKFVSRMADPAVTEHSMLRGRVFLLVVVLSFIASSAFLWSYRYYVRILPLPLAMIDLVYGTPDQALVHTPLKLQGELDSPAFDLTSEAGLRAALNHIQGLSPRRSPDGRRMDYAGITFASWLGQVQKAPFMCTDASLLFNALAHRQGLAVREWWLLDPAWTPGGGHSVAEFYNQRARQWMLVDAQHGAVIRRSGDGAPASMADVLKAFAEGRRGDIQIDYGPFEAAMRAHARGPTTEEYFYDNKGLGSPVLNLRSPTWFATAARNDPVIAVAVYTGHGGHAPIVVFSKLVVLVWFVTAIWLAVLLVRRIARRTVAG
jgi:hypothetical protein